MTPREWSMTQNPPHGGIVEHDPATGETVLTKIDEGAGPYAVLSCREVAFDDAAEFDAWASSVRVAVQVATEVQP